MTATDESRTIRHEFVYVILAHGRGDGLARLVRTLRTGSPRAGIVIHFDRKGELPQDLDAISPEGLYFVSPRIDVTWGGFTLLEAILTSLRFASDRIAYDWLSLISANDYPVSPLNKIEDELRNTDFDAFVKAAPVSDENYSSRYYMQYSALPRFPYFYKLPEKLRWTLSKSRLFFNRSQRLFRIEGGVRGTKTFIGHMSPSHPFSETFTCYKGSGWFTLSSRAVNHLLSFERSEPRVLQWYRRTWIPDESYIQTVLRNAQSLKICDDHRRYIAWDPLHLSHPKTLTLNDLPALCGSGKHFARKVEATTSSALLDALDRVVLN